MHILCCPHVGTLNAIDGTSLMFRALRGDEIRDTQKAIACLAWAHNEPKLAAAYERYSCGVYEVKRVLSLEGELLITRWLCTICRGTREVGSSLSPPTSSA